jgi:hypothetical protein
MMRLRVGIIAHFVMRRVIRVHMPEFPMRTRTHPVTNASRMILRRRCNKAAFAVMSMMRFVTAVMMSAMIVQQSMKKSDLQAISLKRRSMDRDYANPQNARNADDSHFYFFGGHLCDSW